MYKNCTFLNTLRIVKTLTITSRPKDSGNNVPVNGTAVQNWTGREIIVLLCNIHNDGVKKGLPQALQSLSLSIMPLRVRGSDAANTIQSIFRRHVVRMGLLHDAAALRRDGSVSAPPFFLTKSKQTL